MTADEIAAERERFAEACPEFPQTKMAVFGDPQFMFSHTRVAERAWMKRAEIARDEQAELRERVRELAKKEIRQFIRTSEERFNQTPVDCWRLRTPEIGRLAEEAGCWYDHQMQEVPLAEWRARMGGVG